MVSVSYAGFLKKLTGKDREKVQCQSLNALLKFLKQRYGKAGYEEMRHCVITLNGKRISQTLFGDIPLKTGDAVAFFPLCCGG